MTSAVIPAMDDRVERGGMSRNRELIRQWRILQAINAARLGLTVESLAAEHGVSSRTIRRDLAALSEAGFPLYQDAGDGRPRWRVDGNAVKRLVPGSPKTDRVA
jgi:predicted DNA-binding transcriptional regulator YafY